MAGGAFAPKSRERTDGYCAQLLGWLVVSAWYCMKFNSMQFNSYLAGSPWYGLGLKPSHWIRRKIIPKNTCVEHRSAKSNLLTRDESLRYCRLSTVDLTLFPLRSVQPKLPLARTVLASIWKRHRPGPTTKSRHNQSAQRWANRRYI